MTVTTTTPTRCDPAAAAPYLDTLLPRPDGRPWDRRGVYRLALALPAGVVCRTPGRLYLNMRALERWLDAGGTAAPTGEDGAR